ncbi:MAG: heavy-metal-associated domain-containing protein [Bacteroidota bacterium]|jgi:copper chaperone CopZ|nr:heavy-metal-associated domain-containing protein [Bacteroidota bacterium]MCA6442600.1 heavy-metal-associated domain-containing protein [Bacteroidota bacterium]
MCKNTIETALKLKGIQAANWDVNSKLLTIKFDSLSTSPTIFLKAVAEAGYDNEAFIANDYAYKNLPECCQYERKDAVSL